MTDLYQGFLSDNEKELLGPTVRPWCIKNNVSNSTREYELFKQIAMTRTDQVEAWGLVSSKFSKKTQISIDTFIEFADQNFAEGFDCVFINPMIGQEAMYLNVWQQGYECGHVGIEKISQFLQKLFQVAFYMPMGKSTFAFCNYFIAKPCFWSDYFSFIDYALDALAKEVAKGTDVGAVYAGSSSYIKDPSTTMKPFIIERLFSTFIQNYPVKAVAYVYKQSEYEKRFGNQFGLFLHQLSAVKNKALRLECAKSMKTYNRIRAVVASSPEFWFTISHLDDTPGFFSSLEYSHLMAEDFSIN